MPRDNIFTVLGIQNKEDCISNVLEHCFNNSPKFRALFLAALQVPQSDSLLHGKAYTRVRVSESGIPDLIVIGSPLSQQTVLLIENKLGANEGDNQTDRYASPECRIDIIKFFNLDNAAVNFEYRYLTLYPDEKPQSQAFIPVCYEQFLQFEWIIDPSPTSWAAELLNDWFQLLGDFYNGAKYKPDCEILVALQPKEKQEKTQLESSFLVFKKIMKSIILPSGLSLWNTFRESKLGRSYYLAQFSKELWRPGAMDLKNKKYILDPKKCFNIHIEPLFDVRYGDLAVFLHYETNPYIPLNKLKELIKLHKLDKSDYQLYSERRETFKNHIRSILSKNEWNFERGRSNQIGKLIFPLNGRTVESAQQELTRIFAIIADAVDRTLDAIRNI